MNKSNSQQAKKDKDDGSNDSLSGNTNLLQGKDIKVEQMLVGKDNQPVENLSKIMETIELAKFVFISKETSREELLEIIESQLSFWDELERLLITYPLKTNIKSERKGVAE